MLPDVQAQSALKARLIQGHPWVYRNQVSGGRRLQSGTWVRVRCGSFSAIGLWDPSNPIAVRIFARNDVPSAAWIQDRIWEAWEARASIREQQTNAYRWVYGEGDGLPGLVVDRYGDYAIIQTYAQSLATIIPDVVPALRACDADLRGIVMRDAAPTLTPDIDDGAAAPTQHQLHTLWGELPPADLVVQEHGLYFRANLYIGQKTGLFLDQRENRRTVEELARGRRVLNCFAYTGGFSLYALRGSASQVVSVDIGRGLAEAAATNLALNQLDPARHIFLTENCFELLDHYAKTGQRFDIVILDPPSFAKEKTNIHSALRAYTRLNALALRCIEPGGWLVSSSCTSQVSPEQFRSLLADAAVRADCRLQIVYEAGQPIDHPVPAGFPEGRYLKFIVARILPLP